jgi:hypothetical protein
VKGQPREELAFGLSVRSPNLVRNKSRVAAMELCEISGAGSVGAIRGQIPHDGVGLFGHQ